MPVRNRRWPRVARRRRGEQGLTLIELLLSLAILVVLTGFLAGGLSMGRRAFDADRASEISSETGCGDPDHILSDCVGAPGPADRQARKPASGSTGVRTTLSFVGLSEGRSLRGGPHMIRLRRSGADLVVDVMGPATEAAGNAGDQRRRGSSC